MDKLVKIERGRRTDGGEGFSSGRRRHKIEDLIIEEAERNSEDFEQVPLEHRDSREGSYEENGRQQEFDFDAWQKENEVTIDSKLIGTIPPPITEFFELSEMIPDNVFRLVSKSGFTKPTPIQFWVRNHYFRWAPTSARFFGSNFRYDFEPRFSLLEFQLVSMVRILSVFLGRVLGKLYRF